jgi:maltose/maltodextrin transport system substrate-binding protein
LSEIPALAKDLKAKFPNVIPILWDNNTQYFTWPFPASGGGYPFKVVANGYDTKDIGVANDGAVKGLKEVVDLITAGNYAERRFLQRNGAEDECRGFGDDD